MYFKKKSGNRVITVTELVNKGKKAHGRSVWSEDGGEFKFDFFTRAIVALHDFAEAQKRRVNAKRGQPRPRRERYSFV